MPRLLPPLPWLPLPVTDTGDACRLAYMAMRISRRLQSGWCTTVVLPGFQFHLVRHCGTARHGTEACSCCGSAFLHWSLDRHDHISPWCRRYHAI